MRSTRQQRDQERFKKASRITIAGGATNLGLGIVKLVVGYYSGYLALIADGFHSLSDLVSDFVALITLKIGARDADVHMHYGYRRIETLGALFFFPGIVPCGYHHDGDYCWTYPSRSLGGWSGCFEGAD